MDALISILIMASQVILMLVIVQFIISLLFSFNVISPRNEFMFQVHRSINMLLDPILSPIRRIMPNTGAIDFSPMVLIFGIQAIIIILGSV